ncbi:twin-arginine translocation signal domain-containing protein, partial [Nocardioides sp.]
MRETTDPSTLDRRTFLQLTGGAAAAGILGTAGLDVSPAHAASVAPRFVGDPGP